MAGIHVRRAAVATSLSAGLAAALAASVSGTGCQGACQGDFDCLGAGYCDRASGRCERDCFVDQDCRTPPACRDNPSACRPLGLFCSGSGRCRGSVNLDFEGTVAEAPRGGGPRRIDGWDDPPGSGYSFIVNTIALAPADRGFDIDGRCTAAGCIDNALAPLATEANEQIRQGLLGGESLLLLELAGLDDDPYTGFDESFTVKVYGAKDAENPPYPANNFSVPAGGDSCCEFLVSGPSLVSPPPQARARSPTQLERGRFRSLTPVPIQFTLSIGSPPHPVIRFEQVRMSGRLDSGLSSITDGLLGGALPINVLYAVDNPYCKTESARCPDGFAGSSIVDVMVNLLNRQPDLDLDGDGPECLYDLDGDGTVDRCCDGAGRGSTCSTIPSCPGREVSPLDEGNPGSCARSPRMADGYSFALTFTAVRARVLGTSE